MHEITLWRVMLNGQLLGYFESVESANRCLEAEAGENPRSFSIEGWAARPKIADVIPAGDFHEASTQIIDLEEVTKCERF